MNEPVIRKAVMLRALRAAGYKVTRRSIDMKTVRECYAALKDTPAVNETTAAPAIEETQKKAAPARRAPRQPRFSVPTYAQLAAKLLS